MYNTSSIDLPVGFNKPSDPEHLELKNITNFFDYHKYFNEEKTREAKVAYFGLTSFMDDCVGRILVALDESGQTEDTVILYISDHGDIMGDQGF